MYRDSCNDKKYIKKFIILIMGRSGAGKTTYYQSIKDSFGEHQHFDNDATRALTNNTDFSVGGRIKAAYNMRMLALQSKKSVIVMEMIAPLKEMRSILNPDLIIFIDRDFESQYRDSDLIFTKPSPDECGILVNIKTLTSKD